MIGIPKRRWRGGHRRDGASPGDRPRHRRRLSTPTPRRVGARCCCRVVAGRDRGRAVVIARGEVWWGELPDVGRRLFLVMTRSAAIPVLRSVLAAPITRNVREIPTEVPLTRADGMPDDCAARVRQASGRTQGTSRRTRLHSERRAIARSMHRPPSRHRLLSHVLSRLRRPPQWRRRMT